MLTVAVGLAVVLPMLVPGFAVQQGAPDCAVVDGFGRCLVKAADPGRSGGPIRPAPAKRQDPSGSAARDPAELVTPPPPDLAAYPVGYGWRIGPVLDPADFPNTVAADAAEPVTAAVLAQRAVKELTLQPPVLRTSVDGSGFVGVPVWLWIENDEASTGPVSATATAGSASVTAVGKLSAVEWTLGPPGEVVRCDGPGTPWTGQEGVSPDCGYVYAKRSLPERTDGSGRWMITATSVWAVTWSGVSSGLPVEGQQNVRVSAETSLAVGEVQVLVSGGGR